MPIEPPDNADSKMKVPYRPYDEDRFRMEKERYDWERRRYEEKYGIQDRTYDDFRSEIYQIKQLIQSLAIEVSKLRLEISDFLKPIKDMDEIKK